MSGQWEVVTRKKVGKDAAVPQAAKKEKGPVVANPKVEEIRKCLRIPFVRFPGLRLFCFSAPDSGQEFVRGQ